jgi:hypothetical protein
MYDLLLVLLFLIVERIKDQIVFFGSFVGS